MQMAIVDALLDFIISPASYVYRGRYEFLSIKTARCLTRWLFFGPDVEELLLHLLGDLHILAILVHRLYRRVELLTASLL